MLREIRDRQRLPSLATDGSNGEVQDGYIDDEAWAIRYLVVMSCPGDTGPRLWRGSFGYRTPAIA